MPAITFMSRHVGGADDHWTFRDPAALRRLAFPTSAPTSALTEVTYWASLLPTGKSIETIPGLYGLNPFQAVKTFGGDLFGAFAFESDDEAELENVIDTDWPRIDTLVDDWVAGAGGWPHGVRALMPGRNLKIPLVIREHRLLMPSFRRPSTHLVRFGPPGDLVASHLHLLNAAILMSAARRVGLPAVQTRLNRKPWALMCSRFDRSVTARNQVLRKQALTARQLLSIAGEKGQGLSAVFRVIETASSRPAADKLQLIRQLIFNQLCGVTDFDAGSVAFIVTASSIQMAPAQMLSLSPTSSTSNQPFTIGGNSEFEWMRADHWIRFAQDAGVAPGLVFTEIRRMASKIESCVAEAAKELCKSRLELDCASTLLTLVKARTLRCADFVLLAEHQKVPWVQGKQRRTLVPTEAAEQRVKDEGESVEGEPIYE